MKVKNRFYDSLISDHLANNRQMAFISGPRQVGKTTSCQAHASNYINWDHGGYPEPLRKEPKWFLRDWSGIENVGNRAETFIACHLLKAVEGWSDMGLGKFELGYLRNKEKREVDFLVARDGKPWFIVEVKQPADSISPALRYYQDQVLAPFAFQIVIDADYVDADCFAKPGSPLVVPARTFLSQLL
jgi:predicted AAA+ superfamily ATPase